MLLEPNRQRQRETLHHVTEGYTGWYANGNSKTYAIDNISIRANPIVGRTNVEVTEPFWFQGRDEFGESIQLVAWLEKQIHEITECRLSSGCGIQQWSNDDNTNGTTDLRVAIAVNPVFNIQFDLYPNRQFLPEATWVTG